MDSILDKIKSTITVSLGTKNRLKKLKGSESYEDFINYLIRIRNQTVHQRDNTIELQEFHRVKGLYGHGEFKIMFSYNKYNDSQNFIFDIRLELVREHGEIKTFGEYLRKVALETNKSYEQIRLITYFKILEISIQKEIEQLFKHNGRIEDYFSWEQEFKLLNLPKKAFEEDVMEKLREYRSGLSHD
jgi:hypothetical protein